MESQPQNAELRDYNCFFDEYSDYLNTINHFNFKLSIFVAILQVLELKFQKFRIWEILNLHPWVI